MTGDPLPRLHERPHGSPLLTRTEVADLLGYSRTSMATVMARDPDRWPRPAALLRSSTGKWMLLWDRDEILGAAPPAAAQVRRGGRSTISDADGLIPCLECGRRYRCLGRHLHAAHGLTAAEYRDRHELPATGALSADGLRQQASDWRRARLVEDPDAEAHLRPWNTTRHLDEMRAAGIERHGQTRDRDLVREHRAPGQRYAVQMMAAARRERLDAAARAAGFTGLDDAITATAGLPATTAAARIGVGASTVRRHRQRLAGGH